MLPGNHHSVAEAVARKCAAGRGTVLLLFSNDDYLGETLGGGRGQRDRLEPGVGQDLRQVNAVLGPKAQAGQDEALALAGEDPAEAHFAAADLIVLLIWNVAAHLESKKCNDEMLQILYLVFELQPEKRVFKPGEMPGSNRYQNHQHLSI